MCEHSGIERVKVRSEDEQTLDVRERKEDPFETSIEKEPFCATHAKFAIESSCVQVAKANR